MCLKQDLRSKRDCGFIPIVNEIINIGNLAFLDT